jgi:hypothetical protein
MEYDRFPVQESGFSFPVSAAEKTQTSVLRENADQEKKQDGLSPALSTQREQLGDKMFVSRCSLRLCGFVRKRFSLLSFSAGPAASAVEKVFDLCLDRGITIRYTGSKVFPARERRISWNCSRSF